jgi:DNA-binding HxlR family transcriptional regulator
VRVTGLGQFTCELDAAMAVVDGKWKPLILWELKEGPTRFNALHRSLTGISQKMLTQHLKELQRHGVVHRESYHEVPPRVEYSMTPAGEELLEALEPLGNWAAKHIKLICTAAVG